MAAATPTTPTFWSGMWSRSGVRRRICPTATRTDHRPGGVRGVIDRDDADLILATRLDGTPIEQIVPAAGTDGAVLRMRRLRAERALADAISGGELSGVISDAVRNRLGRRAAPVAPPAALDRDPPNFRFQHQLHGIQPVL